MCCLDLVILYLLQSFVCVCVVVVIRKSRSLLCFTLTWFLAQPLDHQGNLIPDPEADYYLFDRVINVSTSPPLTLYLLDSGELSLEYMEVYTNHNKLLVYSQKIAS